MCGISFAFQPHVFILLSMANLHSDGMRASTCDARSVAGCCWDARVRAGGGDPDSRFTVIVNTFKRPKNLRAAIRHYEKCPEVDAIRVVRASLGICSCARNMDVGFDLRRY